MSDQRKGLVGLGVVVGFVCVALVFAALWTSPDLGLSGRLATTAILLACFAGIGGLALWEVLGDDDE